MALRILAFLLLATLALALGSGANDVTWSYAPVRTLNRDTGKVDAGVLFHFEGTNTDSALITVDAVQDGKKLSATETVALGTRILSGWMPYPVEDLSTFRVTRIYIDLMGRTRVYECPDSCPKPGVVFGF